MSKALIPVAVSQRVDAVSGRNEARDGLDRRLAEFLAACGLLAYPVPNQIALVDVWLKQLNPQGVVLSGGNDIGVVPERDATEQRLLKWAKSRRMPVLGICRGMQMMGVAAGAQLEKIDAHVRTRHEVRGAVQRKAVNSFHNWRLVGVPPGYRHLATAPDGTIEAIAHETLPWEGWMWHPEREAEFDADDIERTRSLWK